MFKKKHAFGNLLHYSDRIRDRFKIAQQVVLSKGEFRVTGLNHVLINFCWLPKRLDSKTNPHTGLERSFLAIGLCLSGGIEDASNSKQRRKLVQATLHVLQDPEICVMVG